MIWAKIQLCNCLRSSLTWVTYLFNTNKRNQRKWRNFLLFVTWYRGNASALCTVQCPYKQLYLYLSISCNSRDSGWPNFLVLLVHRSLSHSLTKILYQHEGRNRPEAWCSLFFFYAIIFWQHSIFHHKLLAFFCTKLIFKGKYFGQNSLFLPSPSPYFFPVF